MDSAGKMTHLKGSGHAYLSFLCGVMKMIQDVPLHRSLSTAGYKTIYRPSPAHSDKHHTSVREGSINLKKHLHNFFEKVFNFIYWAYRCE